MSTPSTRTQSRTHARAGYSLLEMLVASVILIVVLNICLSSFISFNRLRHAGDEVMATVSETIEWEEDYRETLGSATAFLTSFRDYQASDTLLIVQDESSGEITLLGTVVDSEHFSLLRWAESAGEWGIRRFITYDLSVEAVEFQRMDQSLLKLSLTLNNEEFPNSIPRIKTLYTALPSGAAS